MNAQRQRLNRTKRQLKYLYQEKSALYPEINTLTRITEDYTSFIERCKSQIDELDLEIKEKNDEFTDDYTHLVLEGCKNLEFKEKLDEYIDFNQFCISRSKERLGLSIDRLQKISVRIQKLEDKLAKELLFGHDT